MIVHFCPRCSGDLTFADDAPADATARCSCGAGTFTRGELEHLEWVYDLDSRIRAIDWGALTNGAGGSGVDYRYRFAFHLGQLFRCPEGEALALFDEVERAMVGAGAVEATAAAIPFLAEMLPVMLPAVRAKTLGLLARIATLEGGPPARAARALLLETRERWERYRTDADPSIAEGAARLFALIAVKS